jgi:hypothetical protein
VAATVLTLCHLLIEDGTRVRLDMRGDPAVGCVWQASQNGAICVRYLVGSGPPAVRPDRNLVAPVEPVLALGQELSGSWCAGRR